MADRDGKLDVEGTRLVDGTRDIEGVSVGADDGTLVGASVTSKPPRVL